MNDSSDREDSWGGPEDLRTLAADLWGGPDWLPTPELPVPPAAPRARRRRRVRMPLWVLSLVAFGAALFMGGWWAHAWLQGGPSPSTSPDQLTAALLPEEGITLDARWGDLPRRLVEEGVIDLDKFRAAAQQAGLPLTPDQLRLLTEESDEPVSIDAENAYFVLDVLWALGLANQNPILTEGPMAQDGRDQAGRYASTGGWTIGAKPGPEYLAKLDLISLTPQQQAVVEEVAFNSYRPCCGNMTAFPDCNHGMAALALTELMAYQGASVDDVFSALKQVSPFWFPNQYHDLALYFEGQDQEWEKVDARLVMGEDYSSGGGWQQVNAWLQQQGVLPAAGGGAGKASGCAP